MVLLIAVILRAPGIPWGLQNGDGFEPDESQHNGIAKSIIYAFDKTYIKGADLTKQWNARGFGTELAVFSYPILKTFNIPPYYLSLFGRVLSLLYSLALIVLTYLLTARIFNSKGAALLAALLLTVFDLNITYSHYGVPDIAQTFWFYLALYLIWKTYHQLIQKNEYPPSWEVILTALAVAMCLSFRYDVIPLFILTIFSCHLLWVKVRGSLQRIRPLLPLAVTIGTLILGFYYLSVGFNYNLDDIYTTRIQLKKDNLNVINIDQHWLLNPLLYSSAVVAGTSFPVVVFFIASVAYLVIVKKRIPGLLVLFTIGLGLSFVLLWAGDATFVRRANIFLPFIAVVAGYGMSQIYKERFGKFLVVFTLLYTAGLSIYSQTAFLNDTRYQALDFLRQNAPTMSLIDYNLGSSQIDHFGIATTDGKSVLTPNWLVLNETAYGRYDKSFTTPFKIPTCCDEVYHCDLTDCHLVQSVLAGNTSYKLVKAFTFKELFPERITFKNLYGTYDTFLGDTLVYKKV